VKYEIKWLRPYIMMSMNQRSKHFWLYAWNLKRQRRHTDWWWRIWSLKFGPAFLDIVIQDPTGVKIFNYLPSNSILSTKLFKATFLMHVWNRSRDVLFFFLSCWSILSLNQEAGLGDWWRLNLLHKLKSLSISSNPS
jgi:hypothetical protein